MEYPLFLSTDMDEPILESVFSLGSIKDGRFFPGGVGSAIAPDFLITAKHVVQKDWEFFEGFRQQETTENVSPSFLGKLKTIDTEAKRKRDSRVGQVADGKPVFANADRDIVCGNPYSFQGAERNIVFLSMVAATNEQYLCLPE